MLLDIDGTLRGPDGYPLPGALEAIAALREADIPFSLASNQTQVTREQLGAELRSRGFPIHDEDLLTTSYLTAELLREHYASARVMLYADGRPFGDADGIELVDREPDVVVLAGAGAWLRHSTLNAIVRQVRAGAELIAMHSNRSWMDVDGLALDVGGVLPGIEAVTGRKARVIGKPSPAFFERALAGREIPVEGALMVGDDIESDVLAAQRLGMTGVLVRTGKSTPDRLAAASGTPDHTIDSIADLSGLLKGEER